MFQLIAGSLVLLPCLSLGWSWPGGSRVLSALVDPRLAPLVRLSAAGGVFQVRPLAGGDYFSRHHVADVIR